MTSKQLKRTAIKRSPKNKKETRNPKEVENYLHQTIGWGFKYVDLDSQWGLNSILKNWKNEIFPKIKNFETMMWKEILNAAGAKSKGRGNNNHDIDFDKLSEEAQKRFRKINNYTPDSLFSLRLDNTGRLFGIRDGRILNLVWYDKDHEICKITK